MVCKQSKQLNCHTSAPDVTCYATRQLPIYSMYMYVHCTCTCTRLLFLLLLLHLFYTYMYTCSLFYTYMYTCSLLRLIQRVWSKGHRNSKAIYYVHTILHTHTCVLNRLSERGWLFIAAATCINSSAAAVNGCLWMHTKDNWNDCLVGE